MPAPPGGAAPAEETVQILEIAGALLADEAAWDRSPVRADGPVNGRYTLYSALATACREVTGRYSHRHPALDAVRAQIEARAPGRHWKQRLAEFNAEASFEDVKAVLTSAITANVMPVPSGGAAPAEETVRILEIAGALLADEAAWDRSPVRADGPVNGLYTLYSALATACHEVTGRYLHRHPALDAVRAQIEARAPGRRWKHRLAEFNAEASFEDVKAVLTSAIAANVA
jgi:hypothetical protein